MFSWVNPAAPNPWLRKLSKLVAVGGDSEHCLAVTVDRNRNECSLDGAIVPFQAVQDALTESIADLERCLAMAKANPELRYDPQWCEERQSLGDYKTGLDRIKLRFNCHPETRGKNWLSSTLGMHPVYGPPMEVVQKENGPRIQRNMRYRGEPSIPFMK